MFENISRSFTLIKQSWEILKQDKELLLFPILSGVITLILFASLILPLVFAELYAQANTALGTPLLYFMLFIFYMASSFIVIYFNVAVIACAKIRLEGGNPTIKDGFRTSNSHLGKILGWSILNATVGLIIRAIVDSLEDKSPFIASLVSGVLGAAWAVLTFFVIPKMIFENKAVFSAIKESGALIKHTWGEQLGAGFTMGFGFMLLYIIAAIPLLIGIFLVGGATAILIGASISILLWIVIATIASALNGIFTAALYNFIKTGKAHGYNHEELAHAFIPKKQ